MRLCSQRTGALQASSTSHGSAATWRPIPPQTDLRTDVDPCGSRLSLQGAAVTPGEVGQRVLGLGGEAQELPPAARVVGLGALELAFDGLPTWQHPQRVWVEVLVRYSWVGREAPACEHPYPRAHTSSSLSVASSFHKGEIKRWASLLAQQDDGGAGGSSGVSRLCAYGHPSGAHAVHMQACCGSLAYNDAPVSRGRRPD